MYVKRVLVVKREAKRPLGRPRRGWVDIIRTHLCFEKVYRIFVGIPEGKRPLGRLRRMWVDNIKIDLWGECSV